MNSRGRINFLTLIIIMVWLIGIVVYKQIEHLPIDPPEIFPISVIVAPSFDVQGVVYAFIFFALVGLGVKFVRHLNGFGLYFICFALIFVGNMCQGGLDVAFVEPLTATGMQYYHDAIKVDDVREWIASFNYYQNSFFMHTKTHPPFAVVVHYFALNIFSGNVLFVSLLFSAVSALSCVIIKNVSYELKGVEKHARLHALLFSVVPSVNIYSATSLDGLVLTASLVGLWGLIKILKNKYFSFQGVFYCCSGFLMINYLTFGGSFFAFLLLVLLVDAVLFKRGEVLLVSLATPFFIMLCSTYFMDYYFNYNHYLSFLVASKIENYHGFLAVVWPLAYVSTRIECVFEVVIFASIPLVSLIVYFRKTLVRNNILGRKIALIAMGTFLLMLVTGAYRTGETARAAIFLIPYVFLILKNLREIHIKYAIYSTSVQTIIMQLFASFFW